MGLSLACTGATSGPNYHVPNLEVWNRPFMAMSRAGQGKVVSGAWWAALRDPTLDALVETAGHEQPRC